MGGYEERNSRQNLMETLKIPIHQLPSHNFDNKLARSNADDQITDAHTLTQAAQVSQHWYSLLQDEQTWKDMCEWHRFTPIITPLSRHRPINARKPSEAIPSAQWSISQTRSRGGGQMESSSAGSINRAAEGNALSNLALDQAQEYYVPHSVPLGPHPSLFGYGRPTSGFKAQFKDAYQTRMCTSTTTPFILLMDQNEIGFKVEGFSSSS